MTNPNPSPIHDCKLCYPNPCIGGAHRNAMIEDGEIVPNKPITPEDKSEGIKRGAFARTDPPQLPLDEKFSIWLDEDGDYMMQSQREHGLQAHASTPEDAVWGMRKVLALAATLPKLSYAKRKRTCPRCHGTYEQCMDNEYCSNPWSQTMTNPNPSPITPEACPDCGNTENSRSLGGNEFCFHCPCGYVQCCEEEPNDVQS